MRPPQSDPTPRQRPRREPQVVAARLDERDLDPQRLALFTVAVIALMVIAVWATIMIAGTEVSGPTPMDGPPPPVLVQF